MRYVRSILVTAALLGLAFAPALAGDGQIVKHSGTVVGIDVSAGRIILAEVGPWQLEQGKTVITYRTIVVMPTTQFAVAERASVVTAGFPGEFRETPVETGYLLEGDFVTVDCRHEGKRMIALRVVVTELDGAEE